jgi:hypothetical protein
MTYRMYIKVDFDDDDSTLRFLPRIDERHSMLKNDGIGMAPTWTGRTLKANSKK